MTKPKLTHSPECQDITGVLEYWHDCDSDTCLADECSDCGCYATSCGLEGN